MKKSGIQSPTPYGDLNAVLAKLVEAVRQLLGSTFVGGYLQGSFATGGFDRHSDADFIIVTEDRPSTDIVTQLQTMHAELFSISCPWAQCLEGSYFPIDTLRQNARCDEPLWYIDNGSNHLELSTHDNKMVVRSILYHQGVLLGGPPADSLIDPVPIEALREEMFRDSMGWGTEIVRNPEVINNHFFQSFAVLHFCRALHDYRAGSVHSKQTGTDWTKTQVDSSWHGLIDRSWSGRPSPELSSRRPADPRELSLTINFVQDMMSRLTDERNAQPSVPHNAG